MNNTIPDELKPLVDVLRRLREEGKVLVAMLFGSFARESPHGRSDVDIAIFLKTRDLDEEIEVIDEILTSLDREIHILRLDDEDESPFMVQEALKGIHLVEPDMDTLYSVAHRALHSAESIRFRRGSGSEG